MLAKTVQSIDRTFKILIAAVSISGHKNIISTGKDEDIASFVLRLPVIFSKGWDTPETKET